GAETVDGVSARRARLDRDEGAGEGPVAPLRDGERVRDGRTAIPGRRAGGGVSAVPRISAPEIPAALPGPGRCSQPHRGPAGGRHCGALDGRGGGGGGRGANAEGAR